MHGNTTAVDAIDQAAPIREGEAGTRIEQVVPERAVPGVGNILNVPIILGRGRGVEE
jgi:hypothetical protein